jgi:hypothetical protein
MVIQRWRTERAYQDLKDELGLDDYEGGRFPAGIITSLVVLCRYAFVITERVRIPPPRPEGRWGNDAQSFPWNEAYRGTPAGAGHTFFDSPSSAAPGEEPSPPTGRASSLSSSARSRRRVSPRITNLRSSFFI